jgi:hypothetical protein
MMQKVSECLERLDKVVVELEITHKHGGFNINYEKATVVWQRLGLGNPNSSDNPVCLSVQSYGTYCQHTLSIFPLKKRTI